MKSDWTIWLLLLLPSASLCLCLPLFCVFVDVYPNGLKNLCVGLLFVNMCVLVFYLEEYIQAVGSCRLLVLSSHINGSIFYGLLYGIFSFLIYLVKLHLQINCIISYCKNILTSPKDARSVSKYPLLWLGSIDWKDKDLRLI